MPLAAVHDPGVTAGFWERQRGPERQCSAKWWEEIQHAEQSSKQMLSLGVIPAASNCDRWQSSRRSDRLLNQECGTSKPNRSSNYAEASRLLHPDR